jgi:hypothetical protein
MVILKWCGLAEEPESEHVQLPAGTEVQPIRSFDVTPDGKTILFDRVQENSDIVLIDIRSCRG